MTNYYVIGTATDVGKTYVSALLLADLNKRGHRIAYYKATMSGNPLDYNGKLIPGDAQTAKQLSHTNQDLTTMYSYAYQVAVSPHLAAQLENQSIELAVIDQAVNQLADCYDGILFEGCGGIICPLRLNPPLWQLDLIERYQAKAILVADAGLGTINAVGLTVHYLKHHQVELAGIILNRYEAGNQLHDDNRRVIEALTNQPILATLTPQATELSWLVDWPQEER